MQQVLHVGAASLLEQDDRVVERADVLRMADHPDPRVGGSGALEDRGGVVGRGVVADEDLELGVRLDPADSSVSARKRAPL